MEPVYAFTIPLGFNHYNIVHLEMIKIPVAIHTWGQAGIGTTLLVYCDNAAVVLTTGATKDLILAPMARYLTTEVAKLDINLCTVHIVGKFDKVADCLYR